MPARRGTEFLASIRDDRQVWIDGEQVADVTTHPSLAACAKVVADVYDLQLDPAYRERLTMPSPTTGDPVSLAYILPRSTADLVRRREMIELLMRRSGGVLGRLPEYMASLLVGLYDVQDILAQEDPAFARNAAAYFEYCRENDLCLTHGFADPPRDQRLPREAIENLTVIEERSDGVIVHGVKSVATLAPYANEYLSLAPNRPGIAPAEMVYFAVPLDAPGLRVHCRQPLGPARPADHPLSASYDEMDAWVVFDQVFVPRERLFYLQRVDVHADLFNRILSWAFYHILIRMAVKAEVLAGISAAMVDYLGSAKLPHVQLAMCDVLGYVETLRAFIYAAERDALTSPGGLAVPNPLPLTAGRIFGVEHHPRILQLVRELCGSGILMAPGEADLASPAVSADVYRYLVGGDARAPERFRLLKLAWEYAAESFGSRQLLFEMHNAGALLATKQRWVSSYDTTPLMRLARQLAGIEPDGAAAPAPGTPASAADGRG
jgi:4-hydroxyphenylacetate 3-monooxygenase